MSNDNDTRESITRRGVLQGTAAATGAAAFTGTGAAYRDILDGPRPAVQDDDAEDEDVARTVTVLGIVSGWIGVEPAEIDGASGPPLRFIEGEENRVIWINGDGSHHNFVIQDEDGSVVEATNMMEEMGEFEDLTFTAEEGMAEYRCEPHPVQMRGPVELIDPDEVHELQVHVEDGNGDPLEAEVYLADQHSFSDVVARPDPEEETELAMARFDLLEDGDYALEAWTYGHERVSEEVTIDGDDEEVTVSLSELEPEDPAETYSLVLEEDGWVGEAPDEIEGETNPTLEFEAEETYAVEWENAIGRRLDEGPDEPGEELPGHNFVIASGGETNQWNTHVRSNFLQEEGETQTVEFVAKEEMGVYLDQSQLDAVGDVEVADEAVDETDDPDEDVDDEVDEDDEDADMDDPDEDDEESNESAADE